MFWWRIVIYLGGLSHGNMDRATLPKFTQLWLLPEGLWTFYHEAITSNNRPTIVLGTTVCVTDSFHLQFFSDIDRINSIHRMWLWTVCSKTTPHTSRIWFHYGQQVLAWIKCHVLHIFNNSKKVVSCKCHNFFLEMKMLLLFMLHSLSLEFKLFPRPRHGISKVHVIGQATRF